LDQNQKSDASRLSVALRTPLKRRRRLLRGYVSVSVAHRIVLAVLGRCIVIADGPAQCGCACGLPKRPSRKGLPCKALFGACRSERTRVETTGARGAGTTPDSLVGTAGADVVNAATASCSGPPAWPARPGGEAIGMRRWAL